MRLLLDTHIFVWAVSGDRRLPSRAVELISDATNSRSLSAASAWEMSIKAQSGRWPGAEVLLDELAEAAADLDTALLPIDLPAAIAAGRLDWDHRDPFDRMLAAQTVLGGYALVTADREFSAAGIELAL
jgi:PIN domain nuclease of toxin-antitoxin system